MSMVTAAFDGRDEEAPEEPDHSGNGRIIDAPGAVRGEAGNDGWTNR